MQQEPPSTNTMNGRHWLLRLLVGEPTVLVLIAINVLAVFMRAFPTRYQIFFDWVDYVCVCYFVFEAIVKIRVFGFNGYWARAWNRFDFFIVLAGMPLLLTTPSMDSSLGAFAIAPLLRAGRFLRFVRLMRFVPDASRLWRGTCRAIRASIGVFIVLFVLNLILAMGGNILFSKDSPKYFGDPLTSSYTLFKVFTVEGWHEIPDEIAQDLEAKRPEAERGEPNPAVALLRGYFIVSVLVGGILGLSLANAIFVDEMTMDNNDELEKQVAGLKQQIEDLRDEVLTAIGER